MNYNLMAYQQPRNVFVLIMHQLKPSFAYSMSMSNMENDQLFLSLTATRMGLSIKTLNEFQFSLVYYFHWFELREKCPYCFILL